MENKAIIPETEDTKKLHILEAVQAAGEAGIILTAENIGNYDFSGLEFDPAEAEEDDTARELAEELLKALFPTDNGSCEAELNCEAVCGNCTYIVHVKRFENGEVMTSIIDNCGE